MSRACLAAFLLAASPACGLRFSKLCVFEESLCTDFIKASAKSLLLGSTLKNVQLEEISLEGTTSDTFAEFAEGVFGIDSGLVLSTGDAAKSALYRPSADLLVDGFPDKVVLTLTFKANAVAPGSALKFDFIFASTELPDLADVLPADSLSIDMNGLDIAFLSDGEPISLKNLVPQPRNATFNHPDYTWNFLRPASSTTLMGFPAYTRMLSAYAPLVAGENVLTITLEDGRDGLRDSALFLRRNSMVTITEGYSYVPTEWSACSRTCQGGTQQRDMQCIHPIGFEVNNTYCNYIIQPPRIQSCGNGSCGCILLLTEACAFGTIVRAGPV
jgi:hypothetical protein